MTVMELEQSLELWTRRLRKRKALLATAVKELEQARKDDIHPRGHLVDRVEARQAQVDEAQRMVDRRENQLDDGKPDADGFMDGVEKVVFADAGEHVTGKPKLVWHSTEGSTIEGAIAAYRASNSAPHFTIDPRKDRIVQHVSVHKAARSLLHPSGTVETNRARAVQVEIVGNAKDMGGLSQAALASLSRLARWIERNADVPRKCSVEFVPFPTGVPKRLKPQAWLDYSGHCGHMHVPSNDHEDPGALKIGEILD